MSDTGKLWIELEKEFPKEYKEWFKEERKFLKEVITPNSEVLEVGCGDGRSIIDLLQITDNIIGIDHEPTVINKAKEKFKDNQNIKFEICDAKKLPFEDKSFDYVVCMTTFANFGNDKFQILKEMKRVCKSSLIVSVFSEEAMPVRKKVYDKFGLNYEEKNGIVKFLDLKKDNVSEQFSETNLREIFRQVQLNIKQIKKVNMVYIVELTK